MNHLFAVTRLICIMFFFFLSVHVNISPAHHDETERSNFAEV